MTSRKPKVVAFGGGHGLHASLSALRLLEESKEVAEITAIVTVADNGGSSGRLRKEFDVLPPGDLRMALAALCGRSNWGETWASVLQHRFAGSGDLNGHNLGNLLIVGLWEQLGDHVQALDWVGRLLGARGRVLPMALVPMDLVADVRGLGEEPDGLTEVRGQVAIATTSGVIDSIRLVPADPPAAPEAEQAIADADWIVLGPGSWYTSVLPNLMVPALRDALVSTSAKIVVVMNLDEQAGETQGLGPAEHLAVLVQHAPELHIHTVVVDPEMDGLADLRQTAAACDARLLERAVAVPGTARHDPDTLSQAFAEVFTDVEVQQTARA